LHLFNAVALLALACAAAYGVARFAWTSSDDETAGGYPGPCVIPASSAAPCAPLSADQERALERGHAFRECASCPEMVALPTGFFTMGSPGNETGRPADGSSERPQHVVTFRIPFAVGKLHVTVDQYAAFVRETEYEKSRACHWSNPGFGQDGSHPVVCVAWDDAKAYVAWLANKTGKPYRLLSEAEWEYAARGRTAPGAYPRFWFGDHEAELCRYGNFNDRKAGNDIAPCDDGYVNTSPAGHYRPNAFGLYDMFGNAYQWTEDCWHSDYNDAAADGAEALKHGAAWTTGCNARLHAGMAEMTGHVVRGGYWGSDPRNLRAAARHGDYLTGEYPAVGFRVARTLVR
jgi:formylglycine-generating enzyme required for sulfatase activity